MSSHVTSKDLSALSYDPESGAIFRGQSRADCLEIHSIKKKHGAVLRPIRRVTIRQKNIQAHRLAWRIYYGRWPSKDIDHKNGDPSDNRISNLREATEQENTFNSVAHRDRVYGKEKNVTFDKGRWKHCWQIHFKSGDLSIHANASHQISAIIAARLIRRILHGEFAVENRRVA